MNSCWLFYCRCTSWFGYKSLKPFCSWRLEGLFQFSALLILMINYSTIVAHYRCQLLFFEYYIYLYLASVTLYGTSSPIVWQLNLNILAKFSFGHKKCPPVSFHFSPSSSYLNVDLVHDF